MNPRLIRLLDILLGKPACWLLTAWRSLVDAFRCPCDAEPRRVLFVKLVEMGSTILAVPAFEEAARRVGRGNVFLLVFESNREILDALPCFAPANVIAVADHSLPAFAAGLLRALRRVRRERIDTAIDLEGLTRASAAITFLTGARRRVGYHNFSAEGPYRGRLFTRELTCNFQHHTATMFLALTQAAFRPDRETPMLKQRVDARATPLPRFAPTAGELERVRGLLGAAAGRRPLAVLNPKCGDLVPIRRWPTPRWVELARGLVETTAATLVITGPPRDAEAVEELLQRVGAPPERALSLAGRTTLRELLTLFTLADVLVSSDSGPCHFASLTAIRTVCLFGPETPQLYAPLGEGHTVLSAGLACSPCLNMLNHRFSPCDDGRCMQAIAAADVLAAVRRTLAAAGVPR